MPVVPELLDALLRAAGPTGAEQAPAAVFSAALADIADVRSDVLGSALARLSGTAEGPVIALFTHIDEIGLIVKAIDESGFLLIEGLGGWDPQILIGQRLDILTDDGIIGGVIGRRPVHNLPKEEAGKVAEMKALRVDIGARDRADAAARVAVGDVAVIAVEPLAFPNGRVVSRALDNRVSVYVAAEVLRRLAAGDRPHADVIAVASVQEETSSAGAVAAAYALAPAAAVVIDVTHASDAPGMTLDVGGDHPFGSGPTILRGPGANPAVTAQLRTAAGLASIPHTIEVAGGRTFTDADGVHDTRGGIPTAIVGIPLRYMHSPVEMIQLSDVEQAIDLLVEYVVQAASA